MHVPVEGRPVVIQLAWDFAELGFPVGIRSLWFVRCGRTELFAQAAGIRGNDELAGMSNLFGYL